jgi:hypothetical protein
MTEVHRLRAPPWLVNKRQHTDEISPWPLASGGEMNPPVFISARRALDDVIGPPATSSIPGLVFPRWPDGHQSSNGWLPRAGNWQWMLLDVVKIISCWADRDRVCRWLGRLRLAACQAATHATSFGPLLVSSSSKLQLIGKAVAVVRAMEIPRRTMLGPVLLHPSSSWTTGEPAACG